MTVLRNWRASIFFLLAFACVLPASSRVLYQSADGHRPAQILIKGELVQADLDTFEGIAKTALRDAARPPGTGMVNVVLDSRGGNIWVAMSIGRIIRKYAFMTRVEARASCVSACVYLLAAGEGRYVGGRVGIHRPYLPNDGVTSARAKKAQYEGINAQTRQYFEEMGLPPSLYERLRRTPPDRVNWLTAHELATFGLTKAIPEPPRPAGT